MKLTQIRKKLDKKVESLPSEKSIKFAKPVPIFEEPNCQKSKVYTLPPSKKENKNKSYRPTNSNLSDNKNNSPVNEDKLDPASTLSKTGANKKEYFNKLGIERINFQFDEYGNYPDDTFQPSIFFFKFLAIKSDLEKENKEKGKESPKLRLYVPDTIILNDLDSN